MKLGIEDFLFAQDNYSLLSKDHIINRHAWA